MAEAAEEPPEAVLVCGVCRSRRALGRSQLLCKVGGTENMLILAVNVLAVNVLAVNILAVNILAVQFGCTTVSKSVLGTL